MHIREYLQKPNKSIFFVAGVIITLLMGEFDYVTGVEISFGIFYLLPTAFVTWYANKEGGLFIALMSGVLWLNADMLQMERYSNHAIPYWNALVRFGFFAIVVYLLSALKKLSNELEVEVERRTADLTSEINERKKAEEELKKKSEKLGLLAKRIQTIREEENTKIAREIHDELGQAMTAIKIDTVSLSKKYSNDKELVNRLMNIVEMVDETVKSIRKISSKLRPRLLDELGLLPAIEWQLKELQSRTGIKCSLTKPDDNTTFNPNVSTTVFRIFQEAITNVARHSKATSVDVSISCNSNSHLAMEIKDNGTGATNGYLDKNEGLGILGMKERARIAGGMVDILPSAEGGTEVKVNIPVNRRTQK